MSGSARVGDRVEIRDVVLAAGRRAPQVPEDTQRVALERSVRGVALEPGRVGEEIRIRTAAGRELRGTLVAVNPAYTHGFGAPAPELSGIGAELRAILDAGGEAE
jgi:hypothetical protein